MPYYRSRLTGRVVRINAVMIEKLSGNFEPLDAAEGRQALTDQRLDDEKFASRFGLSIRPGR